MGRFAQVVEGRGRRQLRDHNSGDRSWHYQKEKYQNHVDARGGHTGNFLPLMWLSVLIVISQCCHIERVRTAVTMQAGKCSLLERRSLLLLITAFRLNEWAGRSRFIPCG